MLLLTVLIALLESKCTLANGLVLSYDTCPFENPLFDVKGFRTDENECISILPKFLLGRENSSIGAALFCARYFKHGRIGYKDEVGGNLTDAGSSLLNGTEVMDDTGGDNWNYFMCVHRPYLDCMETELTKCTYLFELGSCVWQYSYITIQEAERPYGKTCRWVHESIGSPCQCNKCDMTSWTPWTKHVDAIGTVFQTRYRPLNIYMNIDCFENTTFCCGEYSVLRSFYMLSAHPRIRCLHGGQLLVVGDSEMCKCPSDTNGWFCELDRIDSAERYAKRRFLRWGLLSSSNVAFFLSSLVVFLFACIPCLVTALCLMQPATEDEESEDENDLPVISVLPNPENEMRCAKHLITVIRHDWKPDLIKTDSAPPGSAAAMNEEKDRPGQMETSTI
uniref:EGF-like domain-containing protein n=1 Tax=Trichuris muris TaxID=70415 RepID=A0A5S6R626_TRIMR